MCNIRLTLLLLVLAQSKGLCSESYVVELEVVVFGRVLTDEENQVIADIVKQDQELGRDNSVGREELRFYRDHTKRVLSIKTEMIVSRQSSGRQVLKTNETQMEAGIGVMDEEPDQCQLDVRWGFARVLPNQAPLVIRQAGVHWVPFGQERPLTSSSMAGQTQYLIVYVRKATQEDRQPRKISPQFGLDLLKQHTPRTGDSLTARF